MSISAKLSTNTIEELELFYNKFKDKILEEIHEEFLKQHIHINDFKNQFINNKSGENIIVNKKEKKKTIVIKNRCYAYIWKNGEKKQCCNKKTEQSNYCLRHQNNRFYGSLEIK